MGEQLLRVLLIDDDDDLRYSLALYLRDMGHMVDTLCASADLPARVGNGSQHYHVVLIGDLPEPAADPPREPPGLALMAAIKAHQPHAEFLLCTGAHKQIGLSALRAGAYRCIPKPVDYEEIGVLIEQAAEHQRLKGAAREKQILERLLETSTALLGERELQDVFDTICRAAYELFDVDHSGLVRFRPPYDHGRVVAEYPALGARGALIPVEGVPAEQQLIVSKEPLVIDDIAGEPALGPVREILEGFGIRSILIVPVIYQGRILGSFSLDAIGRARTFTDEEIALCKIFAAQVAAAAENAELFTTITRHAKRLETVRQKTLAVTSQLDRDALLHTIIEQAVSLLDAKSGGIYEYRPDSGELVIIADYGREEHILGQTLRAGEGMAGRLVQSGDPFGIINDYNAWDGHAPIYAGNRPFGAVVEVPLRWQKSVIGVLYVDDAVGRTFTARDANLLGLFADHAAIALVNADFAAQLKQQNDYMARLVASSPNGVIAIDRHGNVTDFSDQARRVLKYEPDEVIGQPVSLLYDNPNEPQIIGRLLHAAPDGKLANHETYVRSKDQERIPIRLTATWLYDAQKQRIASVGYFEDLRSIQDVEQRLKLLLKASNTVAQAEQLSEGLQSLADLLVSLLKTAFCTIFLLDESRQFLVAHALASRADEQLGWRATLEQASAVKDWPGLDELLSAASPDVLRLAEERGQALLPAWSQRLGLRQPIQSLLINPLRTRDRVVGLLALGELRDWERAPFTDEKQALAAAIADQTAVLIDRNRLYEITERRRHQLAKLDEASRYIRAEKDTPQLLQEIVRQAAGLIECPFAGVFENRPHLQELELQAVHGLPAELVGNRQTHAEGLAGQVAWTGKAQIVAQYAGWPERETIFDPFAFKTLIGVPLRQAGEVAYVLFVADCAGLQQVLENNLEILERFAAQAMIALQTSRLISQEQRVFASLTILHQISDYIQAARDLDKILHAVLTGVTAGYGLGFNRAALLLLDESRTRLIGRMAIGFLSNHEAQADWAQHHERRLEDFKRYIAFVEEEGRPRTPLGERIPGLELSLQRGAPDPLSRAVFERRWTIAVQGDLDALHQAFVEAFQPALPLVVAPLIARDQVIGLLIADNKFTQAPITRAGVESLLTFANTAAIAIDNIQLLRETEAAGQRLRSFMAASNTLVSSLDPEQVLQDTVERARVAVDARGVSVILIDAIGQARNLTTAGDDVPTRIENVIRPNGQSMRVMETGEPEIIENAVAESARVNPSMMRRGIAAALCLPLSLAGRRIGVMWFHYRRPRYFSQEEIDAVQLYANQAAIAYDNARWIRELERMRQAAEALARAANQYEVLQQIVRSARDVFEADSAVIWSYDMVRDRAIPEYSAVDGIPPDRWVEFRKETPRRDGTAYTVMERGWVGVQDISDTHHYRFIGDATRRRLTRAGAQSFQGVVLSVGGERLGVLYLNYNRLRSFGAEDRKSAQTFANHAALALKKAKLLDQLSKARNTARVVAKVTALEDLKKTLRSVIEGTQDVLGSDVVTIYVYDQIKNRLNHPPFMKGVRYPRRATRLASVLKSSIVFKMLRRDKPYIAEDAANDPLFKDTRFTQDERIASCLAIPLKVGSERVGVMFVNYRTLHHFTDDERTDIELFANQAAVAIHNAQLYERAQQRAKALHALYEAGRAVTGSLERNEIMNRLVQQAYLLTSSHEQRSFASIWEVADARATLVAAYPPDELAQTGAALGAVVEWPQAEPARLGMMGRAVTTGAPQLLADGGRSAEERRSHPDTRSWLVVPLKIGSEVIGLISVEHTDDDAFDEQDKRALEALAAQAAIAMHNASLHQEIRSRLDELERTKGILNVRTAVAWMGMVSSTWRHAIEGHAMTISEEIDALRAELPGEALTQTTLTKLARIGRVAQRILEKPITPPLSTEEGVESVPVNALFRERLRQLQKSEPYCSVKCSFMAGLADDVTVRISPEWLRRVFDILIDNAITAISGEPIRQITVMTYLEQGWVVISVADTGKGIPDHIRSMLFQKPIPKVKGDKGQGMGLLLAQTIIQTYEGEMRVEASDATGTTMVIRLPLERERSEGQ